MNPELIFWFTLRVVSNILGSFKAYMVLKYLNKKPLGMQTIFDEMIKDFIYLNMLDWLLLFVTDVTMLFFAPLNHYAIITMILCRFVVSIAVVNQLSTSMLIRYLYVFYPTQINNAHFDKNFTRLFLVFISFITALSVDMKNTPFYIIASGKNIENVTDIKSFAVPFIIVMVVCLKIMIFTQYKIEKFNQSVDSQHQDVQLEEAGQENQNYFNTYRIVLIMIFFFIISVPIYHLLRGPSYELTLRLIAMKHIILHNVIPIIFIVRNDTLFCFMKIQILKILKCKCRNNQIEPMIELNVL